MNNSLRTRRGALTGALLTTALVAAACGGGDDGASGGGSGIVISGSSTVEPISAANAEKFAQSHADVAISVDGPGTGDGFEIFCNGESDISDASRPIRPAEAEACEANDIEFIELKVAIDGLSVITTTGNDAVDCLTYPELYALLGPESIGFESWSDANELAEELGAEGDLPDLPLKVTAPGEESGTYDTFVELVIEEVGAARVESDDITEDELAARPDYQASPNDNVILESIQNTEGALGWVGYAFVAENPDAVKALAVDGGEGCVAPTPETIASGEYPLARPLYIYVNKAKAAEKSALSQFVDFYLSAEGLAAVTEVGYVALEDEAIAETRSRWERRTAGAAA